MATSAPVHPARANAGARPRGRHVLPGAVLSGALAGALLGLVVGLVVLGERAWLPLLLTYVAGAAAGAVAGLPVGLLLRALTSRLRRRSPTAHAWVRHRRTA